MSYGYEFQINYDDTKKPIFRSDRYQFTVVMSNLNYDVPQDVPQNVPQNVPQDVPQNVPQDNMEDQIIGLIQKQQDEHRKDGYDFRREF